MLEEEELSVDQLEQKLDKILKMCGTMVDTGKTYVAQQRLESLTRYKKHALPVAIAAYLRTAYGT